MTLSLTSLLVLSALLSPLPEPPQDTKPEGAPAPDPVLPQETLVGVVRRADGTPWADAEVHVLGRRYFWTDEVGSEVRKVVRTGARGRFRVRVPADRDYSVWASTPSKQANETGRFSATDVAENATGGRILELVAEEKIRRMVEVSFGRLDDHPGKLECYLVGRTVNLDRVRLPVQRDQPVRLPARPGGHVLLEVHVDGRPIWSSDVQYPYATEEHAWSPYTFQLPRKRDYVVEVLDRKSKKPIPGAHISALIYESTYTDARKTSYDLARYTLTRHLGTSGDDGKLACELVVRGSSRTANHGRARVWAEGYSMVDTSYSSRRRKTPAYDYEESEKPDAPVHLRVYLEPEEARTVRFSSAEGEPVAGLQMVMRGRFRIPISERGYRSAYLPPQVLRSDEKGEIRIPAFSSGQQKSLDLLINGTLLDSAGLDREMLGELPATMLWHQGPLWGVGDAKEADLSKFRIVRGKVTRQNGLPLRTPLVTVLPEKRNLSWNGGIGAANRGDRSGTFVRLLPPGTYFFGCFDTELGYFLEKVDVAASDPMSVELQFTMQPLCTIEGRVVDERGNLLPGAEVSVAGWSMSGSAPLDRFAAHFNQRRPLAKSDEKGFFRFGFVPSARLTMNFRARYHDGRKWYSARNYERFRDESRKDVELSVPYQAPVEKPDGGGGQGK